jgi:hypothetical protein
VVQSFTLPPPIGLSPDVLWIEIAPFARNFTKLAILEIETARLSEAALPDREG